MLVIRSMIRSATHRYQVYIRDIKFVYRMFNCNNSIVNQCIINASHDANALIGYILSFFDLIVYYKLHDLGISQCLRYSSHVHLTAAYLI